MCEAVIAVLRGTRTAVQWVTGMREPLVLDTRTFGVEEFQHRLMELYREGWHVVAAVHGLLFLERDAR